MKQKFGQLVLVLALVHGSVALAKAGDVFVTIDGIDGESAQQGHAGQIEASNFSETWRLNVATGGGTGGGAAKPTLGPVVFDKVQGVASVQLLKALLSGRILPKVILDFSGLGPDGKTVVIIYRITLLNALVVGLNETTNATGGLLDEVQLSFDSATWEVFNPADSTGFDSTTGKVNVRAPSGAPINR